MENREGSNIIYNDEKVCYNCKYKIWAVGIGLGVRCANQLINGIPKPIPGLKKSCEAFEMDVKKCHKLK